MKTLAEQVKAFMAWRGQADGRDLSASAMAALVAAHQPDLEPDKRCTRQNIESLLSRDLRTPRYLVALAGAMGTTAEALQRGLYEPPNRADAASVLVNEISDVSVSAFGAPSESPGDLTVIPQWDTGGAMGRGLVLRDQPGVIRGWSVNDEWLQKNARSFTSAGKLVIVTGFGDSMVPIYKPGDPLLVDTGVTAVDFDGIYFFRVGEEGFVKRLQRIPGEGLVAISENKAYREWSIKPGMDFQVFGRVIKAWCGSDY